MIPQLLSLLNSKAGEILDSDRRVILTKVPLIEVQADLDRGLDVDSLHKSYKNDEKAMFDAPFDAGDSSLIDYEQIRRLADQGEESEYLEMLSQNDKIIYNIW
jgi:hypothetical protein